ncbi:MAG TPA: threonine--tRNA ligase [Blastocatellia bacterium]|nr:threonine--tRNA ligase [Blastocatellia bacterium]
MDEFRKINADLKLWEFYPDEAKQLPFWHPNGAAIRNAIEDFWKREHFKLGYNLVYTPHIGSRRLWDTSGHTERFADRMYPPITSETGEEYILRPMNCPFHILLYKSEPRRYKDLPIRYAELGTVYRKIPTGSFKEMFEVRGFTQDDAHIFCEIHKAKEEIANLIELTLFFIRDVFKFDEYTIIRRLKPTGGIGKDALWNNAQKILQDVLGEKKMKYKSKPGEGVFYGPKIDFEIKDPIYNKSWVCSTIQLDIVLAERFGIEYKTKNNSKETPVIIHRTILGSLERFIGILLSRTKGHFPIWLSPCQVIIIPVGVAFESNLEYAQKTKSILENKLSDLNPRVRLQSESLDIRDAKAQAIKKKIPYILMIGGNERISEKVSVTSWTGDSYSSDPRHMTIDELANELRDKIQRMV